MLTRYLEREALVILLDYLCLVSLALVACIIVLVLWPEKRRCPGTTTTPTSGTGTTTPT